MKPNNKDTFNLFDIVRVYDSWGSPIGTAMIIHIDYERHHPYIVSTFKDDLSEEEKARYQLPLTKFLDKNTGLPQKDREQLEVYYKDKRKNLFCCRYADESDLVIHSRNIRTKENLIELLQKELDERK